MSESIYISQEDIKKLQEFDIVTPFDAVWKQNQERISSGIPTNYRKNSIEDPDSFLYSDPDNPDSAVIGIAKGTVSGIFGGVKSVFTLGTGGLIGGKDAFQAELNDPVVKAAAAASALAVGGLGGLSNLGEVGSLGSLSGASSGTRLLPAINNFKTLANNSIDKATTLVGVAACLPRLLTGGGGGLLSGVGNLAKAAGGAVLNAAMQQLNVLKQFIEHTIADTINQVTGRVVGVLRTIQNLFGDIAEAKDTVLELKDTIAQRAKDLTQFVKNKQNCDAMLANLMGCMTSKIGAQFTRKLQQQFYKGGGLGLDKITNTITKNLQGGGNLFTGTVQKYNTQLNKATTQLEKVNKFAMNFTR